jgi:transducin (beta)-like 1
MCALQVNALRWDPSCTLLATCSDDTTAKVWSLSRSSDQPLQDFQGHSQQILTLRWSPTGPGTSNSHLPLLLATASMDATVKLWDVHAGR